MIDLDTHPTAYGLVTAIGATVALSCPLPPLTAPGPIYNPFAILSAHCDGPIGTTPAGHVAEVHCTDGTPLPLPIGCSWIIGAAHGVYGGPADTNQDGFIDGADADLFYNRFEAGDARADFNADGFVDGIDADLFANIFAGIPE